MAQVSPVDILLNTMSRIDSLVGITRRPILPGGMLGPASEITHPEGVWETRPGGVVSSSA